jgi:hypothetical protein
MQERWLVIPQLPIVPNLDMPRLSRFSFTVHFSRARQRRGACVFGSTHELSFLVSPTPIIERRRLNLDLTSTQDLVLFPAVIQQIRLR